MADEEEIAKETTLKDMVERLDSTNQVQKSIQESSLKTAEVLTGIAKILQAQLDLEEQTKLDKGREFSKKTTGRTGAASVFDKLEMPTNPAEGIGLVLAGITGMVGGFFSELRFMMGRGENDLSKVLKKLKTKIAGTSLGKGLTIKVDAMRAAVKLFFTRIGNVFRQSIALLDDTGKFNAMKETLTQGIKNIKSTFKPITDGIKTVGAMFVKFGEAISKGISNIKLAAAAAGEKFTKAGEKIVKGIKAIGKGIGAFFNFFVEPLKDIKSLLPKPSATGVFGKSINGIKKFFKLFKGFFTAIGKVLAKIAYPITLLLGFFAGITQAIEDFQNQEGGLMAQITAGFFGFIKGAIGFMVTDLMDLVKSAFSWITEKIFGPDNAVTKFLDSFSFTELFKEGIDIIRDFFLGIPKYFKDAFKMGGGVFGALGIFVDDIIDTVSNILGFIGEILGKLFDYVIGKIPQSILDFFNIGSSAEGDALDQAGADLTSPSNAEPVAIASVPEGDISIGGNKGTVTNAAGEKRNLTPEEVTAVRSKEKDDLLQRKRKMHQETIDNNAGDDSSMARRRTNRAEQEILKIDKEIALREPASPQVEAPDTSHLQFNAVTGETFDTSKSYAFGGGQDLPTSTPEEIAEINERKKIPESIRRPFEGQQATKTNPFDMARKHRVETRKQFKSYESNPLLELPKEGSAVNQGAALQSGTSNLKDVKSKQNNAPPMVLQSSANNSKTTNSKVSNNYSSSSVPAWDIYDPFSSQMPSGGVK